jgi:hypothetical protein
MGNINQAAPNLEDLLQFATTTLKQGNKQGAQVLLQQVLEADKRNDRAWVLMAFTSDDPVDRRRCLKTALRLNPNNTAAKRALEKMKKVRTKSDSKAMYYGTIGLVIVLLAAVIACVAILVIS